MVNLFDYLSWRGDLDFIQSSLNPVDNIILSQISYLPFDGIVPDPDEKEEISIREALNILNKKLQNKETNTGPVLVYKGDPELIGILGNTNRFGNCSIFGYVNLVDTRRAIQFSALCINTGDGSCFIVYRGTDLTLVGWKEDFSMSFSKVVPSQLEAVDYLEKMAKKINGPLRLGGHSKGGNLAVYAASRCNKKTQRRITDIYSNDAPGFHESIITSEGFAAIRERVHSFIPQSSVVGMLLEHGNDHTVVKSSKTGLLQHDLYTWEVSCNDIIRVDDVSLYSRFVDKTLREWINSLDIAHREQFFEALFNIINASQAKSLSEFENSPLKSAGRMIQSLGNIDNSTRTLLRKTIRALLRTATRNITLLKPVQ